MEIPGHAGTGVAAVLVLTKLLQRLQDRGSLAADDAIAAIDAALVELEGDRKAITPSVRMVCETMKAAISVAD